MNKLVPNLRFPQFAEESEWEEKKLGEVSDKIGDGLHGTPVYSEDTDIYFINGNNLVNGKIFISKNTKKVDFNTFKKNDKHLDKNTLLISINGTIGNVAKYNGEKVMLGKSVCYINFTNPSDYFYHVLNTQTIQDYFYLELTGSTIKNLSLKTIRETKVLIPSLAEQTQIGNFLTAVDTRILLLKQKLELLKSYKKGIMAQIFSQELRFKDENGQEFPEWEEKNGNDIFKSISNRNHNSDLPILAITQEHGAIPRDQIDYHVIVSEQSVENYKVVEVGDFIISLRSFQGGIEYSNYKGICSPAYIILRPFIEVNSNFFKHYFKTSEYIKLLNKKLEGIRDGKMISYKYFSETPLFLPCLAEQTKIAEFLTAIDQKINYTEQQIAQSEEWKKGLLQQMLV